MKQDAIAIVRKYSQAYVDSDRPAIEEAALVAADFHSTSPLGNRLIRATYFERCWPNSESISGYDYFHLLQDGSSSRTKGAPRTAGCSGTVRS